MRRNYAYKLAQHRASDHWSPHDPFSSSGRRVARDWFGDQAQPRDWAVLAVDELAGGRAGLVPS